MEKPTPQFTFLGNTGLQVVNGSPEFAHIEGFSSTEEIRTFAYSPEGRFAAWILPDRVKIFSTATAELVSEIEIASAIEVEFSPRGTYLSVWERYVKKPDSDTNPHKNLTIWNTETGEPITSFTQKSQQRWNVQWSEDEIYFTRMVSGEITAHDVRSFSSGKAPVLTRLKLDGLTDYSVSPGKRPIVAVFVGEKQGRPASVKLYDLASLQTTLAQKTFYKADSVTFMWNKLGTHVLVLTRTETDKTGKSYYGESNLYFLAIAGNYDCRVDLDKAGPVHDVAWSPNSKEFVVVYGSMPAKSTLFDHRANAIHQFGEAPRNFVRFNPHGRIICTAGFGNLSAGDVDFWDRQTLKKIASVQASNSSFCEWSPDGKYLMTGTLYRRLKVDNGYKLWHYTGVLVHQFDIKELHQLAWRPQPASLYPERRELSPPPKGVAAKVEVKKVTAYRPPGARGAPASFSLRSLDTENPLEKPKFPTAGPKQVVGMAPKEAEDKSPSKAAVKNKKKRESTSTSVATSASSASVANGSSAPLDETEKKIKAIQKKLKQIAEIKARKERGEKLELTQLQKMETEAQLQKELENLKIGK